MKTFLLILLIAVIVVIIASVITLMIKSADAFYAKDEEESNANNDEIKLLSKPALPLQDEVIPLSGKTVEDTIIPIGDVEEEAEDEEEVSGLSTLNLKKSKPIPFAKKLLALDKITIGYFDSIDNEMRSYKRMSARISHSGMSYRVGRKLVAKITVRGKTLTFNLALNVNDFKQSVYFQKDKSDVKSFEDIPFTVKVKSDRGAKNAVKLAEALCVKENLVKNAKYEKVDSKKLLKESLK